MKYLNVICKPVKRWFHFEKPLPLENEKYLKPYFMKDHLGRDVMCWLGWETYMCWVGESRGVETPGIS
jgi:hypothetical protein